VGGNDQLNGGQGTDTCARDRNPNDPTKNCESDSTPT